MKNIHCLKVTKDIWLNWCKESDDVLPSSETKQGNSCRRISTGLFHAWLWCKTTLERKKIKVSCKAGNHKDARE